MSDVFISYSRKNLEFVEQLYNALKEQGKDPCVQCVIVCAMRTGDRR